MTVKSVGIDIQQIRDKVRANTVRPTKDFDAFLDAAGVFSDSMGNTATTAMQMYGPTTAHAAITAAFTGTSALNQYSQQMSQIGAPSFAGGSSFGTLGSTGGMGAIRYAKTDSSGVIGTTTGSSTSVIPGTDNFSQADLINTMNQNNLQLLELQAQMQSNQQMWNTKSNILSADHRARMAMIEKFTAR